MEDSSYEDLKMVNELPKFTRRPIVAHDRKMSASQLGVRAGANTPITPQLNRRCREALHRKRDFILVPIEPKEAIPFPVKFARRLTALKMSQLIRRQRKFAREASTAKHLLEDLMPGPSRIRSAMQVRHDEHLSCFKQVTAEIKARLLAVEGRLAKAV